MKVPHPGPGQAFECQQHGQAKRPAVSGWKWELMILQNQQGNVEKPNCAGVELRSNSGAEWNLGSGCAIDLHGIWNRVLNCQPQSARL